MLYLWKYTEQNAQHPLFLEIATEGHPARLTQSPQSLPGTIATIILLLLHHVIWIPALNSETKGVMTQSGASLNHGLPQLEPNSVQWDIVVFQ